MAYFRNVTLSVDDFESIEEYERAVVEQERIEKINKSADINDPVAAKMLYDGFVQHPEMFRTIVGQEFLQVLRENCGDLVNEPSKEPVENYNPEDYVTKDPIIEQPEEVPLTEIEVEEESKSEPKSEPKPEPKPELKPEQGTESENKPELDTKGESVTPDSTNEMSEFLSCEAKQKANKAKEKAERRQAVFKSLGSPGAIFKVRITMIAYVMLTVISPMAGMTVSLAVLLFGFVELWYGYIKSGMKGTQLLKAIFVIVVFPVGIILTLMGIMKKIKYTVYNWKPFIHGVIAFAIPLCLYTNSMAFSDKSSVCVIPVIADILVNSSVTVRIAIVVDILIAMALFLYAALKLADGVVLDMARLKERGIAKEDIFVVQIQLPVAIICMFKAFIGGNILEEEKLTHQ